MTQIDNPNAGLPTTTDIDIERFLEFGWGPRELPSFTTLHQAVEAIAHHYPQLVAIEHEGTSITYGALNFAADALATQLRRCGVTNGDCVGIYLRRSIPMVVGIVASLKVGAAYVPQDAGVVPQSHLSHITDTIEAKAVITLSAFMDKMPTGSSRPPYIIAADQFMSAVAENPSSFSSPDGSTFRPDRPVHPDDRCFILFTSGTTGMPNGVQVTHRNVCNIIQTSPGDLGLRPGMKVAQLLSISFDMAAWEILGALSHGATLVIRGADFTETARQVDAIIATPTVLSKIDHSQCHQVKVVAVAGEPCPRSLADTWSQFARFYNSCGPTETTIVNTMQLHNPANEILSIGKPTPNNTVYVLDENLRPLPIGEVGEMWAGGDCVTAGYLNNPELTAERYRPDPFLGNGRMMFRTRDLGRWTENGELEHLGRTDDQVKVRGFRVELDSVSAALESVPGVVRAATLKFDSQNLVGFVSPAGINQEAAQAAVDAALPYYCVPKHVISLPALPMTDRGKIDKRELLRIAQQVDATEASVEVASPTPPATPTYPLPEPSWWGRVSKSMRAQHHNRLLAMVLVLNAVVAFLGFKGIGVFTESPLWTSDQIALPTLANLAIANFTAAILIRQHYVVNFLFWAATRAPVTWPLRVRQLLGKVYHFGGIHVGGTLAGTAWFGVFVAGVLADRARGAGTTSVSTLGITLGLILLLAVIVVLALPPVRQRFHDLFERSHRFGGWTSLVLFWALIVSFTQDLSAPGTLLTSLAGSFGVWALVAVTFSVVLPWLRLRKVPVKITRPSNHVALVEFDYGVTPMAGSSTGISRSPLTEWHSFANVPWPDRDGFRLTISRAGDWTGKFIDDMPSHVWVKAIPTAGVANIEVLFKKVVYVATGSGIGPCLPHLLAQEVPAHLIWATKTPRETYGAGLVDEILEVQPNALIWDTDANGRPDLVQLAYQAVQEHGAEAVICISNKKLTWQVVSGMESRGIPAYGAIWDS